MLYSAREEHLKLMLAGLQKTGISLIEYDGTQLIPAVMDDDLGIYVLIPKLATWLNLALPSAITLFFNSICYGAAAIGILGFCKLYRSWPARIIATAGILILTKLSLIVVDVYSLAAACAVAVVPWALYYYGKRPNWSWYLFFIAIGLGCGFAHYIRAHSGTAPLLFVLTLLALGTQSRLQKITALALLLLGTVPAHLFFQHQLRIYHAFVAQELPQYSWVQIRHPFWHTVYIGLGFITNDLGLSYSDAVAINKVRSINPLALGTDIGPWKQVVSSDTYEQIVRTETIQLFKHHTFYVIRVLAAKAGVLLLYLLLFASLGLLAALYKVHTWHVDAAFGVALAWSALPGILAIPWIVYLAGFVTFAGLYSIVGINDFLTRRLKS
jgi:hypothetical protein